MWILETIELLPRPSLRAFAPALVALTVYFGLGGGALHVFGAEFAALSLALAVALALRLWDLPALRRPTAAAAPVAALLLFGFASLPVELAQTTWVLGQIGLGAGFVAIITFGSDAAVDRLPSRWAAGDEPLAREVLMIHALRIAAEAAVAAWLIALRPAGEWLLFVSLGRLLSFYVAEWLVVLYILVRDPD